MIALGIPLISATEWGAPHLGFSPGIYAISLGIFLVGFAQATWAHKKYGSLSRIALRSEVIETIGAYQVGVLMVLGPGSVLNFGWLAILVTVIMAVPVVEKIKASLMLALTTLVGIVVIFLIRDGWEAGLGAAILAACCAVPLQALLGYQRQSVEEEVHRRLLQQKLTQAEVEIERQRISRGLHDGLSGHLTALLWRLRAHSKSIDDGVIAELEHRIQRSLIELRNTVWNVDGSPVEFGYLKSRMESLITDLDHKRVKMTCTENNVGLYIPAEHASLLLASVAELSLNALKQGLEVHISLEPGPLVIISDHGPGLPDPLPKDGGILSLKGRIEKAGGEFQLNSEPGRTVFRISFPAQLVAHATM